MDTCKKTLHAFAWLGLPLGDTYYIYVPSLGPKLQFPPPINITIIYYIVWSISIMKPRRLLENKVRGERATVNPTASQFYLTKCAFRASQKRGRQAPVHDGVRLMTGCFSLRGRGSASLTLTHYHFSKGSTA